MTPSLGTLTTTFPNSYPEGDKCFSKGLPGDWDIVAENLGLTELCPNCGQSLQGQYCAVCGQNQRGIDRFFASILNEAFENLFSRDSRPGKTLFALFFKPGFLSVEYFAGRRARYVPPVRLYLISSLLFFFILSVQNLGHSDEAVLINSDETATAGDDSWKSDLQSSIADIEFDFLSAQTNQKLSSALASQANKAVALLESDPAQLSAQFQELIPQIMFFLLPVFALVLKGVYVFRRHYYTEHLILCLHNHSFLFIALLLGTLLESMELVSIEIIATLAELTGYVLVVWIVLYMYLAMRVYYRQGHMLTFSKFVVLIMSYFTLFAVGSLIAFLWGVMTL